MATDDPPVLLSGGNPQIPKGDGPDVVRAYIEAMPGWKRDVGRQLDALVEAAVPGVARAVRWNSPFYGVAGNGWFASVHCLTRYVKVTFFAGASLLPELPVSGTDAAARFVHLHEGADIDGDQLAEWFRQAAALPGWRGFV